MTMQTMKWSEKPIAIVWRQDSFIFSLSLLQTQPVIDFVARVWEVKHIVTNARDKF